MKKTNSSPRVPKLAKDMLVEAERAVKHTTNLMDKHELHAYIENDNHDINGYMVEDSEDITPEQVSILGSYSMARKLYDNLKLISEGKERKTQVEVIAIEVKDGKNRVVDMKDIPQEIKDKLIDIIKEHEDE